MLDHVFINVKATENHPDKGTITEIAAIRTNRKGDILAGYTCKVGTASDESSLEVALSGLSNVVLDSKFDSKYIVVAQFAEFERGILRNERKKLGKEEIFEGRAWLCVSTLSWPLVYVGLVGSRGLESVARHFGIANEAPNTATGNSTCTMQVYWQLMRRYRTLLRAEEMIRDVGGDRLESIRKFIGF